MRHKLKTDSDKFWAVVEDDKTFEFRKSDRTFQQGDILELKETEYTEKEMDEDDQPLIYTGNRLIVIVTYILDTSVYGLPGWVIMGFKKHSQIFGEK